MGLLRLAWKNIFGNAFRSVSVLLCAAVMAGLALVAVFVVRGAEASLNANLERLGADILVLPWGTMTEKIGGIRLMSAAIERWMPAAMMDKIAAVDGVAQVSPQQFITALNDSQYSPYPKMYLVAYDPQTDFALRPWLKNQSGTVPAGAGLAPNEAVAGAHVTFPEGGDTITLYGAQVRVVQRLVITETTIDDTLFVSFETAERMTAWSLKNELNPLMVMPGTISAIMVKLNLESDPHEVAVRILDQVSGVVPLETPDIYQGERRQMIAVLRTLLSVLGALWALMVVFMGLVFSIALNERRYEIGVLRALGFPGLAVFKSLLLEGAVLALTGGVSGLVITILVFSLFGDDITGLINLPLVVPSAAGLALLSVAGQALALASVTLAAFLPAWRISHEEVAVTIRD